jgi:uncharacterized membrane protein HdeD (DUF308 family)
MEFSKMSRSGKVSLIALIVGILFVIIGIILPSIYSAIHLKTHFWIGCGDEPAPVPSNLCIKSTAGYYATLIRICIFIFGIFLMLSGIVKLIQIRRRTKKR